MTTIHYRKMLWYLVGWLLLGCAVALPFFLSIDRNAQLKKTLMRPDGVILKALFTPYDAIKETLIMLIEHEKESIQMMAYLLSDKHIARALQDAAINHKINVTIIVDYQTATNEKFNHGLRALSHHVNMRIFQPLQDGIMHNKFIIFGSNIDQKPLVWTGSFNYTSRAQYKNMENVVISNDAQVIAQYRDAFTKLLAFTLPSEQVLTYRAMKVSTVLQPAIAG